MAYPIQPVNQIDNWVLWIEQTVSGSQVMQDWSQYISEMTFSVGDTNPDYRRKLLTPQTATIHLSSPASNGTTFAAGQGVVIKSASSLATTFEISWAGKINDVEIAYSVDKNTGAQMIDVTLTASDVVYELSQKDPISTGAIYDAVSATGEYYTLTNATSPFSAAHTLLGINSSSFSGSTTNVNITNESMSIIDFMQMIADTTKCKSIVSYVISGSTSKTSAPGVSSTWTIDWNVLPYGTAGATVTLGAYGIS